MSKPLLLSLGAGKIQEFAGTATGQTPVWSEGADEWVLGTPSSSGGGGVTWYLNENTAAGSPTTNLPTGASGVVVKNLSATADGISTTAVSTSSVPVLPTAPEIIAGFVTDATVPGLTGIPAGLWEFNVWAQANGNTTNQSYIQLKIYKYDGSTAPTLLATSTQVYIYDPADVTQYTASVLIPASTSLLTTDRIYVEVLGGSTTSNRQITLHFGNGEPSHVHTTIDVPVNLGTGVSGTLPVANGGTGVTTAAANTVFAGPTSGGNAAPGFRTLVAADIPSLSSVYLPLSGGTLTGKLITAASASGSAGFNLPHGALPTSPVNGDLWTTSAGLFVRLSTSTQQVATLGATNTFTASTNTFGNSTQTGAIGLATGATLSGSTKTVNIGTGGLAGSTTTITIGATSGTSTTLLNGTVTLANDLAVTQGGTGASSLTQYGVLVGAGTSAVQVTGAGATGQYLKSGNNAANPSFATIDVGEVTGAAPLASPTFTGTVTLPLSTAGYVKTTSGGVISSSATVPTSDLSGSIALGSQVSGTLPVANGGTNNASLSVTQGTVYYGDGSKLVGLAPGTSGQFLKTNGAGANPEWASAGSATTPYDVLGRFAGNPASSSVLYSSPVPRAVTVSTTIGNHYFYASALPSAGTSVITVYKTLASNGTKSALFTATWTAGQAAASNGLYQAVIGTVSNNTLVAGDVLSVEMGTTNTSFTNPQFAVSATA